MQLAKKIGGGSYSTTEIFTGDYWIDGKPIYQRVIVGTIPTTSANGTIVSSTIITISDIGSCVNMIKTFLVSGTKQCGALPAVDSQIYNNKPAVCDAYIGQNGEVICYNAIARYSGRPLQIIIEYTKS